MINSNQRRLYYSFRFILTMEIMNDEPKLRFEGYTPRNLDLRQLYTMDTLRWRHIPRVILTHGHSANLQRVEATKIIVSIKESTGTGQAKTAQLFTDHIGDATADDRAEIGNRDVLMSFICPLFRLLGEQVAVHHFLHICYYLIAKIWIYLAVWQFVCLVGLLTYGALTMQIFN